MQQVTTKNLKKVEVGKRLAVHSHRKREEQVQVQKGDGPSGASRVRQYYGIGAVLAVGVIGGLGYYIYQTKKGSLQGHVILLSPNQALSLTSSKWIKSILGLIKWTRRV